MEEVIPSFGATCKDGLLAELSATNCFSNDIGGHSVPRSLSRSSLSAKSDPSGLKQSPTNLQKVMTSSLISRSPTDPDHGPSRTPRNVPFFKIEGLEEELSACASDGIPASDMAADYCPDYDSTVHFITPEKPEYAFATKPSEIDGPRRDKLHDLRALK